MQGSNYILLALLFGHSYLSANKGASFSQLLSSGAWYAAAMSSSGQYQLLPLSNGNLYKSSDYGATWTAVTTIGTSNWRGVAMSGNGQFQYCCAFDSAVYKSSDYGANWQYVAPLSLSNLMSIACSDDGNYVTVVQYGGGLRYSSNGGTSSIGVAPTGTSRNWLRVAMSASGQHQVVCAEYIFATQLYTHVYVSSNYGATWTPVSLVSLSWRSVAVSASGQYMYAASTSKVFRSTDYGANWTEVYDSSNYGFMDIACTSDGSLVYVLKNIEGLLLSADHGQNYTEIDTPSGNMRQLAISEIL